MCTSAPVCASAHMLDLTSSVNMMDMALAKHLMTASAYYIHVAQQSKLQ